MTETGQSLPAARTEPLAGDSGCGENLWESTGRNRRWDSAGVSVQSVVPEAWLGGCGLFLDAGECTSGRTNTSTCSPGKAGGGSRHQRALPCPVSDAWQEKGLRGKVHLPLWMQQLCAGKGHHRRDRAVGPALSPRAGIRT